MFSIIIPAHNAENRIKKALDSINGQSFKDYEIIVVCDSCDDDTFKIAESNGAKTIICEHKNDGLTRNEGIEIANGEYIMFMDDDDWWLHNEVLSSINQVLKNNSCDILCCGFIFGYLGYRGPLDNGGCLFPNVWSKVWKKEKIGLTRFPNVYSVSDSLFNQEMFKKNLNVKIWDAPIYYYDYMREGSISATGGNNVR